MKDQPNYKKSVNIRNTNKIQRDQNFVNRQKKFHKSKTIKDDAPDSLYNSNSMIKVSEKLSNVRRTKKRMTQLEQNIDLPDKLLGIDEFKERITPKDTHKFKQLRTTSLNPDLPDILEPINEIITTKLPKPFTNKEESKNQELIDNNKVEYINNKEKEKNIKENYNDFNDISEEEKNQEITGEKIEEINKKDKEKEKERNNNSCKYFKHNSLKINLKNSFKSLDSKNQIKISSDFGRTSYAFYNSKKTREMFNNANLN
jgi:hypothetical protein